ncbi:MAG: helix-turn-helix domain-containing protein [Azospira sp.]|jgi:ActR/RegA family two-component response regulator|nr:helix-turn-helix domain-containing protein [Azospira sp.]
MSAPAADGVAAADGLAVVDLRPAGDPALILIDKLQLIERLLALDPGARIVVLGTRPEIAEAAPGRARRYLADAAHVERLGLAAPDLPDAAATAAVAEVEAAHIRRMLELHQGNRMAAARALGIHVTTLRRKLARAGG